MASLCCSARVDDRVEEGEIDDIGGNADEAHGVDPEEQDEGQVGARDARRRRRQRQERARTPEKP
jgi:hypothetical protein